MVLVCVTNRPRGWHWLGGGGGAGTEGSPVCQVSLTTDLHHPLEAVRTLRQDKVAGEGRRRQTGAQDVNSSPGDKVRTQALTREVEENAS